MKRAILSLYLFLAPFFFPVLQVHADSNLCNNAGPGCEACFQGGGAWTVFGCIGEGGDPTVFINNLLQIGVGLGGGIAFLLILVSGFQTITSGANPEKLHEAKELMTAAISGLLLIIFSVFILRLIGVDILQIPGLS